jgi:hypothetical protein
MLSWGDDTVHPMKKTALILITLLAVAGCATPDATTTPTKPLGVGGAEALTTDPYYMIIDGYTVRVVCDPHGYRVFFYDGSKAGGLSTEVDDRCLEKPK